jgi:hypothetical protein
LEFWQDFQRRVAKLLLITQWIRRSLTSLLGCIWPLLVLFNLQAVLRKEDCKDLTITGSFPYCVHLDGTEEIKLRRSEGVLPLQTGRCLPDGVTDGCVSNF